MTKKITKDTIIGEIIQEHLTPEIMEIFDKNGLHCIGCHIATSESIGDGARTHGLSEEDIDKMVDEINGEIEKKNKKNE